MDNDTPNDSKRGRGSGSGRIAPLFLGAAFILVYLKFFFGWAPSGEDVVLQYLPYQELVNRSLAGGEWPWWNPWTFCGRPLMGDIQVGVLYPPNWLHRFAPLPISFTLLLLGHAALGLTGCYKLGRTWGLAAPASALFGVLFSFSGFLTVKLLSGVILFLYVAAWLPWMLREATLISRSDDRKSVYRLALLITMSLLAGSPQITFYSWLIVLGAAFVMPASARGGSAIRAKAMVLGRVVAAFALAFVLTAPQTLETFRMTSVSFDRAGSASWDYVTEGSFAPRLFGLFATPGLFGPGARYWGGEMGYSEASVYMTLWAWLVLLPLGITLLWRRADSEAERFKRRIFWGALGLIAIAALLAPGRYSPLFRLFYEIAPGFDVFRVPARLLFGATFGVSIAGAIALDRWMRAGANEREQRLGKMVVVTSAGAGVAVLAIIYLSRSSIWTLGGADFMNIPDAVQRGLIMAEFGSNLFRSCLLSAVGLVCGAGFLLALKPRGLGARSPAAKWAPWAVPAIAAFELAIVAWPNQTATRWGEFNELHYPETELVAQIKQAGRGGRILWTDSLVDYRLRENHLEIPRNAIVMQGLTDARGYDPVNARAFGTWMNRLAGLPPDTNPRGLMFVPRIALPAWLTLMGVDLVLGYDDLSGVAGLEAVGGVAYQGAPAPLRLWRNTRYRGLVVAASIGAIETDPARSQARSAELARANPADPLAALVLDAGDGSVELGPSGEIEGMTITPMEEGPNRFAYRATFEGGAEVFAAVVLAQTAYPGWKVRVDGERAELRLASGAFPAVIVGPGSHEIEFERAGYPMIVLVAWLAAMILVAALGFARRGGFGRSVMKNDEAVSANSG